MKRLIDKSDLIAEIEKRIKTNKECMLGLRNLDYYQGKVDALNNTISFINTLETKDVDFERELGKYVSDGIHRFFPGVEDDYCTMDSVVWQDYVIETAEHFYELGMAASSEARKGE